MRCYRKILHISYKDHVTNEEVRAKIQQENGPHEDLLGQNHFARHSQLVSWCFKPSQPQRVTSWPNIMFNLYYIYSARKSSNHKLPINHKISHDTNLHKTKQHEHPTQNFQRISPFGITPVEKAHKVRTRWYRGPFRRFINTRFKKKSIKKEWTEAIKNIKYYINA